MEISRNTKDVAIGFLAGIAGTALGIFIWWAGFSKYGFITTLEIAYERQLLGQIITLGSLLNLGIFFLLLKINSLYAKGVVAWSLTVVAITLVLKFI